MIDRFLDLDVFGIDNYFLHDLLNFNHLWNLFLNGNENLLFSWHFHDFLFDSWDFDELLDYTVDNLDYFDWLVYDFLHFDVFGNLNNLLHVLLDRDNFRYFDQSIDDLLDNFFDFNDLGYNSKHFQDIVNVDNTKNLLVDHADDSLINL